MFSEFYSEFELAQFLAAQSAIRTRGEELWEADRFFALHYSELLRDARVLAWRSRPSDLEAIDIVSDFFLRFRERVASSDSPWWQDSSTFMTRARAEMRRIAIAKYHSSRSSGERVDIEQVKDLLVHNPSGLDDTLSLQNALDRLTARQREVVSLLYFFDYSINQVAELLGVSPRTISRDWMKARSLLATTLGAVEARQQISDEKSVTASTLQLITFTRKLYKQLLEDTDRLYSLSDDDFERLVADRLAAMGLGVQRVGNINRKDGGVDIVAWPEQSRSFPFLLAAQVKHHHSNRKTGHSDVRDFLGVINSQGSHFHFGVIVTNTSFSADAQWFAKNNSKLVRLRDLNDLCRWMRNDFANGFEWREIPDQIELAPGINIEIPKKRLWIPA